MDHLPKVFNSFEHFNATEKHFNRIELRPSKTGNETERILKDNTFGNLIFRMFSGYNINKIGSNVFTKTGNLILSFYCYDCSLVIEPNYDIQNMLNSPNLQDLNIVLKCHRITC